MKTNSSLIMLLALVCYVFVTACSGGDSATQPDTGGGTNGNTGLTANDFYISVKNTDKINSHIRTSGSFTANCSIPSTGTSQDLTCIVDVPEGDLNYNGVELNYNAPAGMCAYFVRRTYWFYNQEVGYGPTAVRINKSVNNDGDILSYQCGIDGGAMGACASLTEVEVNSESDAVTCAYNLTSAKKANCCFGEYSLTIQSTNTDTGVVSTTSRSLDWGGTMKECIGGAGRTDWDLYSSTGYPLGAITESSQGISSSYKISAPLNTANDIWNISVANYYTPAVHSHDGYVSNTVSTIPYFINPIDDRDGTLLPAGNVPYTFECLSEAYEIKNRINVYIREWDVYTDYLAYIASSGVTSVPDRPGEDEPADCDGIDGVCNDRWDLDDFVVEYLGAPYDTATPADRRYNFPEQSY